MSLTSRRRWLPYLGAIVSILAGTLAVLHITGRSPLLLDMTPWSKDAEFECLIAKSWQPCHLPPVPYLLVTSDIHLSSEVGRWPDTTKRFTQFLEMLKTKPPEEIFITGDVVDNATEAYAGSIANWRTEWRIFEDIKKSFPQIRFRQSYGTGHDWLSDEMLSELEERYGPKHGLFSWRGLDFLWLSFGPGAFRPGSEDYGSDLNEEDYQWIEHQLEKSKRMSVMFHVPLLTSLSEKKATFSGGRLIALDPRDRLYSLLRKYGAKIDRIFSGHIHETFRHDFEGIPYFSCPFMDRQSFCTIERVEQGVEVRTYRAPNK